jgi:GT2 family glycosyltransferase
VTGTPRVSVYLPTRNRATSLAEAAASVLAQDYTDLELLIVDDASGDDTRRVAEGLARQDPRVRYWRLPAPRGAPAARNVAIGHAAGEFVTGLDDDDLMLPGRIAALVAAHQERYAFVCSGFLHERAGWRRPVFATPRRIALADLLHYNLVGNQALVRTERLRAVGGYDESMVASQDYDLWTRLVLRFGPALRIPGPSYVFREGSGGDSITASPRAREGARQYLQKHAALMIPAQRRSQQLLAVIAGRERIRMRDLPRLCAAPTAGVLLRYWAATNLPVARGLRERWRGRVWPSSPRD